MPKGPPRDETNGESDAGIRQRERRGNGNVLSVYYALEEQHPGPRNRGHGDDPPAANDRP
jgi:hypothetical protein